MLEKYIGWFWGIFEVDIGIFEGVGSIVHILSRIAPCVVGAVGLILFFLLALRLFRGLSKEGAEGGKVPIGLGIMDIINAIRTPCIVALALGLGTFTIGYLASDGFGLHPILAYSIFPMIIGLFVGSLFLCAKIFRRGIN